MDLIRRVKLHRQVLPEPTAVAVLLGFGVAKGLEDVAHRHQFLDEQDVALADELAGAERDDVTNELLGTLGLAGTADTADHTRLTLA